MKGMRFFIVVMAAVVVSYFPVFSAEASIVSVPSSFSVARGQASLKAVAYRFTLNPTLNTTLSSSGGNFLVGGDVVSAIPLPLTAVIKGGAGSVAETITVPAGVIEAAISRGTNRFTYFREFVGSGMSPLAVSVKFNITTEAGANFDILRIGLYFDNKRAESTIDMNAPLYKAYADIRYVGSGLLQGYWEVDGRILSHVNQPLTYAGGTTLMTLDVPSLPTNDVGSHVVRFVVTNPASALPSPSIVYFVVQKNAARGKCTIRTIYPSDSASVAYSPLKLKWSKMKDSTLFLVGFYDDPDSKPLFSAYTKKTSYTLPKTVLESVFSPGKKYYWKVIGFDARNNMTCGTESRSFFFKK